MAHVSGVLLAAGAGKRFGRPKALAVEDGEPWLASGVRMLLDGGCDEVLVVLGARADEAAALVPADPHVRVVVAADWEDGVSASLRAGLTALEGTTDGPDGTTPGTAPDSMPDAALVSLVDLVGLPATAAARVRTAAEASGPLASALARATYRGLPGHPVLLGRDHWA
ncbi:nucleotidyltransferase family protein, partial [Agromyces seonyuensis]